MTFITHRQFAVFWALAGAMILYTKQVTNINYYLALIIIIPLAKAGAEFPDYDHSWQNIKNKTVPSWLANKIIHMTGGRHRSWQTHSIDIAALVLIASYYLPIKLYENGYLSDINKEILIIVMLGFSIGWWSHIFSDMLTSNGVKLVCWLKFKVKLVPKKIFKLKFKTGEEWEGFVYSVTRVFNIVIGVVALVFPYMFTEKGKELINNLITLCKNIEWGG